MDDVRFDELARRFATAATRRHVLGSLGAIAGAVLGLSAAKSAHAACPPEQIERRGLGCICKTTGRPPASAGEPCPCPAGKERCGETCVAVSQFRRDPLNCGGCGNVCSADTPFCAKGTCVACLNDSDCDDGIACTIDTCVSGVCQHAPDDSVCADDNPCVHSWCDALAGCVAEHLPIGTPCGDGLICNGEETCDGQGACQAGTPVACGPCHVCSEQAQGCEIDDDQEGRPCSEDGHVCKAGDCVCPEGMRECDGACLECCDDDDCPVGRPICQQGVCSCSGGLHNCEGTCRECCSDDHCLDPAQSWCSTSGSCSCRLAGLFCDAEHLCCAGHFCRSGFCCLASGQFCVTHEACCSGGCSFDSTTAQRVCD